jgi:acyl carrier protein
VYKVDKISDEYRIYIDDEKFLTIKNVERFHKYFKIISQHRNEIINKIID